MTGIAVSVPTSHRVIQARTDTVLVRHTQYLVAQMHTDYVRIWVDGDQVTVLLLDTNMMPREPAGRLAANTIAHLARGARAGQDLLAWFHEGRGFVESWLERAGVPRAERFTSAGMLRVAGTDLEFIGAYAPVYRCDSAGVERLAFDGTVWGISGLEEYPVVVRHAPLTGARAYVLSDGMLESRNSAGKINGDSLLFRYWAEFGGLPDRDVVDEVSRRYREADSEGLDSHGLLSVEPLWEEATGAG